MNHGPCRLGLWTAEGPEAAVAVVSLATSYCEAPLPRLGTGGVNLLMASRVLSAWVAPDAY